MLSGNHEQIENDVKQLLCLLLLPRPRRKCFSLFINNLVKENLILNEQHFAFQLNFQNTKMQFVVSQSQTLKIFFKKILFFAETLLTKFNEQITETLGVHSYTKI